MRAVAVCTGHAADQLAGAHVLAAIDHFHDLAHAAWFTALFPETSDAAADA